MKTFNTIIIGAGQAGLAAGYFLKKEGLDFLILEATDIGGSWSAYYESLQLFTPAEYSSLPGLPFSGDPERYPTRDEMTGYLQKYAAHFALPVKKNTQVERVEKHGDVFVLETSNGTYQSQSVVVAAGPFNEPHIPTLPGVGDFIGITLHSHEYKNTEQFLGKRVVVVGRGASAVQIATELAEVADTTLAVTRPVKFIPRSILGKDITFWSKYTIDLVKTPMKGSTVIDTHSKKYKEALNKNQPPQKEMFSAFYKDGVVWADGTKEPFDVVIFGTGYKPTFSFLPNGLETRTPGLFFMGLPNMRNYASATVRGAGKDAKVVIKRVAQFLKHVTVAAAH